MITLHKYTHKHMKLTFFILACTIANLSFAQPGEHLDRNGPLERSSSHLGTTANEMNFDRARIYLDDKTYDINGLKVIGSPFLYRNWNNGSLTTADGRVFSGYKFKYNVFNQTVSFLSGTDSLDVSDEIKEFSLIVLNDSNKLDKFTFINANNIKKQDAPLFYEVLIDNPQAQLLKVNKKFVDEGHDGLPIHEGKKIFGLQVEFHYYDKTTKKLTRIKGNGANLSQFLKLTEEDEKELRLVDLNKESDLVRFLKDYFARKG